MSTAAAAFVLGSAAALAASPAATTTQTAAKTLGLTYEVYAGGLHIFTFDVDLVLDSTGYRIAAEGGTRGMTSVLYKWDVKLAAEGEAKAVTGKPAPGEPLRAERYVTVNTGREKPKTMQLAFEPAGAFSVVRDPPETGEDAIDPTDLPSKLPTNIVDPLSAGLVAAQNLAKTGQCEQTIPVFDGKRRYNLLIHDAGQGIVPKSRASVYHGSATLCRFTMERISGFGKKKRRYANQWDEDKDEPPLLWIAQVRDDMPPIPVRFTGAVSLGSIIIHLIRIESGSEIASTDPADNR